MITKVVFQMDIDPEDENKLVAFRELLQKADQEGGFLHIEVRKVVKQ